MKNKLQRAFMQGLRELHIKILQTNNLAEIGNYLQEILDKVIEVPPAYNGRLRARYWKESNKSEIIGMMKADVKSILDGTYSRVEIAKYKATLDIAWLKKLFADPSIQ
jgi:hypothetical protein